jgi:hypothetical protein
MIAKRLTWKLALLAGMLASALAATTCGGQEPERIVELAIGDAPALKEHTSQAAINAGELSLEELVERGKALFTASFNTLDGAGRPETTDVNQSNFRARREYPDNFNRISGPDANTCFACHNLPRLGAAADNANNVFILADRLPLASFDGGDGDAFESHTLQSVGNERNPMSLFGSGVIEMLAREMTAELQGIADAARKEAVSTGADVTRALVAKGVSFGYITARPDRTLDTSGVEGVDADLIVKPFQQKGVVVSLRELAVKAFNTHFGMQASERFGDGADPDGDGVADELSRGDVTATVVFMAALPVPGEVMPSHPEARAAAKRGREHFDTLGCAVCHIPELRLDNPIFSEPNPYNPPGKLQRSDVSRPLAFDLTKDTPGPHLKRAPDGSVMVPAFTDLKRHRMGEALDTDVLVERGVPTDQFITRKLWGVASEPPFLHHGRATLLSEAILLHGGEAEAARGGFAALPPDDQAAVVEFLKTLQILPGGATELVINAEVSPPVNRAVWLAVGSSAGGALLLLVVTLAYIFFRRRKAFKL